MPALRLLTTGESADGHGDEVLACAYTPDGRQVLSGGWDGHLRLWDARGGEHLQAIPASKKAVSACAVSPNGKQFLSGSLEGMLAYWDARTYAAGDTFLAHTRPIAAIVFTADGQSLATASWDRNVILWDVRRKGQTLSGHEDVVAGCQGTLDGKWLLSWSFDQTVRLWEVARLRCAATLEGHADRVLAGAISPDGRWAASGGRDGALKLWDLTAHKEAGAMQLEGEVRFCGFLRHGQVLLAADTSGRVALYALPGLLEQHTLTLPKGAGCGALSAAGDQAAFGSGDGRVYRVAVDGFDEAPLLIAVTRHIRHTQSRMQKLFGKTTEVIEFRGSCPACQAAFELPGNDPNVQAPCPKCGRQLRVCTVRT